MILKLDTVSQTSLDSSTFDGRMVRTGLIEAVLGELPMFIPDPTMLVKALATSGLPQKGDQFPFAGYEDWIVRRHRINAINAFQYSVLIIYEWLGALRVRDTSTLESIPIQTHPGTNKPFEVTYLGPQSRKQLTFNQLLPLRHLVVFKTVQYEARANVLAAFGSVNDDVWQGLPKGFWMVSALDGDTYDNGQTYTYTVTFSTRQTRDWSDFGGITDDYGHAIHVANAASIVFDLKAQPYKYDIIGVTDQGFLRTGNFPLASFATVFGI